MKVTRDNAVRIGFSRMASAAWHAPLDGATLRAGPRRDDATRRETCM
ncbi:hypothetical protein PT2222_70061 [Paraburkholderia tropica]